MITSINDIQKVVETLDREFGTRNNESREGKVVRDFDEDKSRNEYLIRLEYISPTSVWMEVIERLKDLCPGIVKPEGSQFYKAKYDKVEKASPSIDDYHPSKPEFVNARTGESIENEYAGLSPEIAKKVREADEEQREKDSVPKTDSSNSALKEGFQMLPVDRIMFSPKKLREDVDEAFITEMAHSMMSQGVIQAVLVRPRGEGWFEVVAGEQRVRAAKQAGLKNVPVNVRRISDFEAYKTSVTENLQRKDLSAIEIARAIQRALTDFPEQYPTQEDVARDFGKSEQWVTQHLNMLKLEDSVHPGELAKMTERQARAILSASPEKQKEIIDKIADSGVLPSSREIEAKAKSENRLPCEDCFNNVDNSGDCRRIHFHVDDQGTYVCEYQNKDLPEKKNNDVLGEEDGDNDFEDDVSGREGESEPPPVHQHKGLDTHQQGKNCPICGSPMAPKAYERLKEKFKETLGGLFK